MAVRLKVVCSEVVEKRVGKNTYTKDGSQRIGGVRLYPVSSGSPENDAFFNSTPAGELQFTTINAKALDEFEPGEQYYVTIERAIAPEAQPVESAVEG